MSNDYSWCDVVMALTSLAGLIPLFYAGWKWFRESEIKHRQFVEDTTREKDEDDDISSFIESLEDETSIGLLIEDAKDQKVDAVKTVEAALSYFSKICRYRASNRLSENEFNEFRPTIVRMLSNKDVKRYVEDGKKYLSLLEIGKKMGISESAAMSSGYEGGNSDEVEAGLNEIPESGLLSERDFTDPTMEIKINRAYRAGMTAEQLYEATRGWWKLNIDSARRVKFVLSVAFGIVKEMFEVKEWHEAGCENSSKRIQFSGNVVKDVALRNRFIGKSAKGLYSKGAANPVRYFGVKSEEVGK